MSRGRKAGGAMYKWILALIGIMAASSAVTLTCAQSQKPPVRHSLKQPPAFSPAGMQASRARLKAHYAKLNAPWTGDDRPYQGIRDQIDGALATGRKPAAILAQYESAANAKPSDPQALFGWGYAAYKAATAPNGIDSFEAMQELSNVYLAVERVHFPQTYN